MGWKAHALLEAAKDAEIARLSAEIARLRAALKPFADCVYNDNGDMTISAAGFDDYAKAYFAMRPTRQGK